MPTRPDPRYDQAREHFDELDVEEQARFLVEATATTLAWGVRRAGAVLADGLEDVLRRTRGEATSSDRGPGAAEPETSQRQSPRSGSQETESRS